MDVILIPCAMRPEFLHYCLEQLNRTKEARKMKVLFHVDFRHDPDIHKVIDTYKHPKEVIVNKRHAWNKLPVNVLRGYLAALSLTDRYVFMIEDDVMVGTDFFNWHYKVHSDHPDIFCSIASRNNNHDRNLGLDPVQDKYYLSHLTYQSLGVCFHKDILEHYVRPHINQAYFSDNKGYCVGNFASALKANWCEQAGLVRRIQEKQSLPIAYPFMPRCYHAGFYGKNRKSKMHGSLGLKINQLGEIIFSPTAMRAASMHELYYDDSTPIPLNQPVTQKVFLDNIKNL